MVVVKYYRKVRHLVTEILYTEILIKLLAEEMNPFLEVHIFLDHCYHKRKNYNQRTATYGRNLKPVFH